MPPSLALEETLTLSTPDRVMPVVTGSWFERAACRSADSELFFGPHRERPGARHRRERLARRVCLACPIQRVCAAGALAGLERNGLWGGLGENDRAALWVHLGLSVPGVTEALAGVDAEVVRERAERAAWLATGDPEAVGTLLAGTGQAPLKELYDAQRALTGS